MGRIEETLRDPLNVPLTQILSREDSEKHLLIADWSNRGVSEMIQGILEADRAQGKIRNAIEWQRRGVKLSAEEFFKTKTFNNPKW